ncbi:MAG: hypothetical protein M3T56_04195 [Chloroflexota bacterium]|nr:hypothetical protein [Chloroflexota bacterium]
MAGVILDLDGVAAQPVSPLLGRMLSAASAAAAAATLLMIAALPHEQPAHALASGPSVLEEAFARQNMSLTLRLQLPVDVAAEILMPSVDGVSGPARPAPKLRSFRLRDSNQVVSVAMLPGAPAVVRPTNALADELSVHGAYAANYSVEATSLSVVRWTEDGMTYEISSRALLLRDLVRIAEQVR